MVDIDFFKQINDNYGHHAGDEVLRQAVTRMSSKLRTTDVIGRYGGDEFLILLPRTTKNEAVGVLERIRKEISNKAFVIKDFDLTLNITLSIGISAFPEDGESREDLIRAADESLYLAKQGGRNLVVSRRK